MRNEQLDEFVERVRAQSDILQVVQTYVPMRKKGNRYWGCCPFHGEKTPSFSVVPDKGFFYCFGCHAGGNVFKFLSLIENVTYFEAIKLQAEKLGIPLPQRQRTPQEMARDQQKADLRKVNEMARDFGFNNIQRLLRGGEAEVLNQRLGVQGVFFIVAGGKKFHRQQAFIVKAFDAQVGQLQQWNGAHGGAIEKAFDAVVEPVTLDALFTGNGGDAFAHDLRRMKQGVNICSRAP